MLTESLFTCALVAGFSANAIKWWREEGRAWWVGTRAPSPAVAAGSPASPVPVPACPKVAYSLRTFRGSKYQSRVRGTVLPVGAFEARYKQAAASVEIPSWMFAGMANAACSESRLTAAGADSLRPLIRCERCGRGTGDVVCTCGWVKSAYSCYEVPDRL